MRTFHRIVLSTLRLHITGKSAILGKSIKKLLHISQRIGITENTNSGMNVKVGDVCQYYAYKTADVLDKAYNL